jgi:hypothetical protein
VLIDHYNDHFDLKLSDEEKARYPVPKFYLRITDLIVASTRWIVTSKSLRCH